MSGSAAKHATQWRHAAMFVIRSPFGIHGMCTSRETADRMIARLSRRYSGLYVVVAL